MIEQNAATLALLLLAALLLALHAGGAPWG